MDCDKNMSKNKFEKLSYKKAGVNIEAADQFVSSIKQTVQRTHRKGVMNNIGGFGALFEIPSHFKQPILVSGTDGVGTKLKLAISMNAHHTIGIDLVAMCANDILSLGAEPLFFLDYFATAKLNSEQAKAIISGISKGCELAGAALIGGETAEMPGIYRNSDYDLAGFCVGVVEKEQIINGSKIETGDSIIALASSGPHSNGYSLIREIIDRGNHSLDQPFNGSTLGRILLQPTKIYVKSILALLNSLSIHGIAHITGGGLTKNIPRILPHSACAKLNKASWNWPEIFHWLQKEGNIANHEMHTTFNLGIGMIVIVPPKDKTKALDILHQQGEVAWEVGSVTLREKTQSQVLID